MSALLRGEIHERDIHGKDLFGPRESKQVKVLYIESVVALGSGGAGNPIAIRTALVSARGIVTRIAAPTSLQRLYALGASPAGVALMNRFGFKRCQTADVRLDHHDMYRIEWLPLLDRIEELVDPAEARSVSRLVQVLKGEAKLQAE